MKTLPRKEALEFWNQWWEELEEEWFKIEVLQDYYGMDNGPSLDAWLVGEKEKSIKLMPDYAKEWIEMCQRSPAKKRRFHIMETPYTPYIEWEIELYKKVNIPLAREEVFLISKEKVAHLNIPDGDIMIWDSKRVARNYYTPDGVLEKIDFY